jgi:hypothetical protein
MMLRIIATIFAASSLLACVTKHGGDTANSAAGVTPPVYAGLAPLKGDDRQYLVSGDFNGDGYLDNAYASAYGKDEWRLIVHLDVLSEDGEIVVLDRHTPDTPIEEVRLETRPAGKYLTVCGQMPKACDADSPRSFSVQSDGIYLLVIEASASLIYWDRPSSMFVRRWLVD